MAHAQYPVTEPVGIRWIPSRLNIQPVLEDFLDFAKITEGKENFERRNPAFFYPEHCYGNPNGTDSGIPSRNYTAIGYIEDYNKVEFDVLQQLQIMFDQQQEKLPGVFH